ncbi:MAG: hypothetical protein EBS07_12450 [Sphingobacteriia bacterium]|nr:hypothetical protein [Sphingobacteriia bacterium]
MIVKGAQPKQIRSSGFSKKGINIYVPQKKVIVGFPQRIRVSGIGQPKNLYRVTYEPGDYVEYLSDDQNILAYWDFTTNVGEVYFVDSPYAGPTLATAPQNWPSTGWANGITFSLGTPTTLVTLTYTSPQSFVFSNAYPTIVFSSVPSISPFLFNKSGIDGNKNVGSYSATINVSSANYQMAEPVVIPFSITKRDITIALNNQTSTYAPNQSYFWYVALLSATNLAPGDSIFSAFGGVSPLSGVPAIGANAGSYTIFYIPTTLQNYNVTNTPTSVTWTINKADQFIYYISLPTNVLSDATTVLSASASSGLPVSFSVVSGPATINGSTLSYTGAGNVVLRASQAGNTNYNAAPNVDRTIAVTAPESTSLIPVSYASAVKVVFAQNFPQWYAAGNSFLLNRQPANNVRDGSYTDENGNYVPRFWNTGPNQNYIGPATGPDERKFELIPPNNNSIHYPDTIPGPDQRLNYWTLRGFMVNCDEGNCGFALNDTWNNAHTDPATILNTGWTVNTNNSLLSFTPGISVANTNTIFLRNALSFYQSYFGSGYFIGNPQSFSKIDSNTYFDGSVNYIRYIGYWQWYWDNNDNSYNVIDFTSATDPNFIPNNWGSNIFVTS